MNNVLCSLPRTLLDTRSGSMEPAFYRGDLLFLTNPSDKGYKTGDITVYKVPGADIPIVHRVIETHDVVSESKEYVSPITVPLNGLPSLVLP